MAKKNNIGLGLAALAVGAGAVAAVTKGHKAEVKKGGEKGSRQGSQERLSKHRAWKIRQEQQRHLLFQW